MDITCKSKCPRVAPRILNSPSHSCLWDIHPTLNEKTLSFSRNPVNTLFLFEFYQFAQPRRHLNFILHEPPESAFPKALEWKSNSVLTGAAFVSSHHSMRVIPNLLLVYFCDRHWNVYNPDMISHFEFHFSSRSPAACKLLQCQRAGSP